MAPANSWTSEGNAFFIERFRSTKVVGRQCGEVFLPHTVHPRPGAVSPLRGLYRPHWPMLPSTAGTCFIFALCFCFGSVYWCCVMIPCLCKYGMKVVSP